MRLFPPPRSSHGTTGTYITKAIPAEPSRTTTENDATGRSRRLVLEQSHILRDEVGELVFQCRVDLRDRLAVVFSLVVP